MRKMFRETTVGPLAGARGSEGDENERFAQQLLSRWRFFVTSGGFFWIQPASPMLPFADLVMLVKRLLRADLNSRFAEIELDFTGTAVVGAPRGATRRLLKEAGRHLGER